MLAQSEVDCAGWKASWQALAGVVAGEPSSEEEVNSSSEASLSAGGVEASSLASSTACRLLELRTAGRGPSERGDAGCSPAAQAAAQPVVV